MINNCKTTMIYNCKTTIIYNCNSQKQTIGELISERIQAKSFTAEKMDFC
jgi:hypothetical protein